MRNLSRVLIIGALGVAIAGCTGSVQRYGKGDDHEVAYRVGDTRDEKVYVPQTQPQPRVVYVQPAPAYQPAPTYYIYEPTPTYRVVPVTRTLPATRYYYVN